MGFVVHTSYVQNEKWYIKKSSQWKWIFNINLKYQGWLVGSYLQGYFMSIISPQWDLLLVGWLLWIETRPDCWISISAGPIFIKLDQLDLCIKVWLKINLIATIMPQKKFCAMQRNLSFPYVANSFKSMAKNHKNRAFSSDSWSMDHSALV